MTEEQKNDAAPQSAQGDLHRENEAQERKGLKVPRTVWALGFVSLLMDISSEMIHALLPLFMAGPLGASAVLIGLVEGAGEGAALITKVFSGAAADRFGHRKLLVFLGYALGVLSKPVFALADSVALVFAARVSDRIGKGLRGAPRDAIVAAVTPKPLWGEAYGIRQSLDAAGAFVGPALASLFLFFWTDDLRSIFWLALIPGALCLLLILMGVEDAPESPRRNVLPSDAGAIWRSASRSQVRPFERCLCWAFFFHLLAFPMPFLCFVQRTRASQRLPCRS